ncbi:MAG: hypothetical protein HYX71_12995 [Opitutae bacterium]|nr:hypothetical protein [Opitutae bacterium]
MNRFDCQWQKLTALARQAPADPGADTPHGFATRVAARAAALPAATPWRAFERFAFRGLVAAAACCLAAVAFNYSEFSADPTDSYVNSTADSIDELLDIS